MLQEISLTHTTKRNMTHDQTDQKYSVQNIRHVKLISLNTCRRHFIVSLARARAQFLDFIIVGY